MRQINNTVLNQGFYNFPELGKIATSDAVRQAFSDYLDIIRLHTDTDEHAFQIASMMTNFNFAQNCVYGKGKTDLWA